MLNDNVTAADIEGAYATAKAFIDDLYNVRGADSVDGLLAAIASIYDAVREAANGSEFIEVHTSIIAALTVMAHEDGVRLGVDKGIEATLNVITALADDGLKSATDQGIEDANSEYDAWDGVSK